MICFLKASCCAVVKILCLSGEPLTNWSIAALQYGIKGLGYSPGKGTGVVTSSSSDSKSQEQVPQLADCPVRVSEGTASQLAGRRGTQTEYCKRFRAHVYQEKSYDPTTP